jgi:CubicO group peptidase (beta-lactamase class C family)
MKTLTKSISILVTLMLVASFSIGQSQSDETKPPGSREDIDTFIAGQMEYFHVPGLSACIIVDDEVVWNNNYGYMNLLDSIPVNDSTLFSVWSIGKSLTAACVMQQWENGSLDIDQDLSNYLNFNVINPGSPTVAITSRMLLNHTSTMSDHNLTAQATIGDPTETLAFFCENYFPEGGQYYSSLNYKNTTPGTSFFYSNFGVGLNGYLVEAISGTAFHEYAKENLLSPLNMHHSAWFLGELNLDNLAIGYDYASSQYTPNDHLGHPCYPGLTFRSTALELSQFAIMMLKKGHYQGNQILESSTIDTMLTVQNPNWGFDYGTTGLGFFMREDLGDRIVWGHNGGSSRGYAAHLYFCEAENTGVVIMTNSNQYVHPLVEYMFDYAKALNVSEIYFEGYSAQGEGIAGWNANGSGPEPAATGHQVPAPGFTSQYYYGSSHDYITENPDHAAFHFLEGMKGFPNFEEALAANGYTPGQVKVKYGLCTLGDDIEGIDWFFMDNWAYSNYYENYFVVELDGEPMLSGYANYSQMYINTQSGNWLTKTSYSPMKYNAETSSTAAQAVAQAFLNDLNGDEVIISYESTFGSTFNGSGRTGAYYNIFNGILSKGHPTAPFNGLYADNEGFAGWDADGSGPEPEANGHLTQHYYRASADYDGIDPDPNACLAHFQEGSVGFINTLLQLQYRGFEIGDLKMKMGLSSLGPDVLEEDWGFENGKQWCNYYNNSIIVELDGEPILEMMADTNKQLSKSVFWGSALSYAPIYNIAENASQEAQFVAQSFMKDWGERLIYPNSTKIMAVAGSNFSENGRTGSRWEILDGNLMGAYAERTFIPEGPVSGTWTAEDSPIYVDGHLTVEDGQTLTIEPGVKVAVRGPYHFDVQGCVKAEGNPDENIIFTRSNPNLYWDGFDYFETPPTNAESIFDYCLFEYGYGQGSGTGKNSGGAIAIKQFDAVKISNSVFRNNKVDLPGFYPPSGGAIGIWDAAPTISKCIFYNNEAEWGGAFFSYENAAPVISNSLFYNNYSGHGGAISFYDHCNGILINNTIVDNQGAYGGALHFFMQSNPQVINTILWGNVASISGNQVYSATMTSSPDFYYCDIEGGQAGFGGTAINGAYLYNIEGDPEFMDEPPYAIDGASPCFNMGTPDTSAWFYQQYLPQTCLCGNPRVCFDRIDIGAYEYLNVGMDEFVQTNDAISAQPNPFRNSTKIAFELDEAAQVKIEIYNSTGSKVATLEDSFLHQGQHQTTFTNHDLPEGIYFCRVQIDDKIHTLKIIKTK